MKALKVILPAFLLVAFLGACSSTLKKTPVPTPTPPTEAVVAPDNATPTPVSDPIFSPKPPKRNVGPVLIGRKDLDKNPIYNVKAGDCLWNISHDLYGDPFLWPVITLGTGFNNPDLLDVGSVIRLPTKLTLSNLTWSKKIAARYESGYGWDELRMRFKEEGLTP